MNNVWVKDPFFKIYMSRYMVKKYSLTHFLSEKKMY